MHAGSNFGVPFSYVCANLLVHVLSRRNGAHLGRSGRDGQLLEIHSVCAKISVPSFLEASLKLAGLALRASQNIARDPNLTSPGQTSNQVGITAIVLLHSLTVLKQEGIPKLL